MKEVSPRRFGGDRRRDGGERRTCGIDLAGEHRSVGGPISLTSISETFGPSVATSSTAGTFGR
jgi:hypothetical protein